MCNSPSRNGIPGPPGPPGSAGMAGMESEANATFGSIDQKFKGIVVSPKQPFFLISGHLFVQVRKIPAPPASKDFIEQRKKSPEIKIMGFSLSETREPWDGFKDIQQASNYYHAVQRFNPHMALRIIEIKEVQAHVEAVHEKYEESEDCC